MSLRKAITMFTIFNSTGNKLKWGEKINDTDFLQSSKGILEYIFKKIGQQCCCCYYFKISWTVITNCKSCLIVVVMNILCIFQFLIVCVSVPTVVIVYHDSKCSLTLNIITLCKSVSLCKNIMKKINRITQNCGNFQHLEIHLNIFMPYGYFQSSVYF